MPFLRALCRHVEELAKEFEKRWPLGHVGGNSLCACDDSHRELPVTLAKRQHGGQGNICRDGMAVRSKYGIYHGAVSCRAKQVHRGFWIAIGSGNEDDERYSPVDETMIVQ